MTNTMKKLMPIAGAVLLFAACSKDDDVLPAPPTISGVEIGAANSKIAYAGSDLHMEAEIEAAANIASVQLSIHPEGATGWDFDSVYTEGFKDLKNAEFHKHIDVPADAAVGHYHLHFTVTDAVGQKTEIEEEIEIQVDPTKPGVGTLELELEGGDLHIDADINAPNKIAKVEVEVHGTLWENEYSFTDAAMVGQTTYQFHKHIDISAAPAGHYHVHFVITDQAGKVTELEDHVDKL